MASVAPEPTPITFTDLFPEKQCYACQSFEENAKRCSNQIRPRNTAAPPVPFCQAHRYIYAQQEGRFNMSLISSLTQEQENYLHTSLPAVILDFELELKQYKKYGFTAGDRGFNPYLNGIMKKRNLVNEDFIAILDKYGEEQLKEKKRIQDELHKQEKLLEELKKNGELTFAIVIDGHDVSTGIIIDKNDPSHKEYSQSINLSDKHFENVKEIYQIINKNRDKIKELSGSDDTNNLIIIPQLQEEIRKKRKELKEIEKEELERIKRRNAEHARREQERQNEILGRNIQPFARANNNPTALHNDPQSVHRNEVIRAQDPLLHDLLKTSLTNQNADENYREFIKLLMRNTNAVLKEIFNTFGFVVSPSVNMFRTEVNINLGRTETQSYMNPETLNITRFTYKEIFNKIVIRILNSKSKEDLVKRLQEEVLEGIGYCMAGKITRLLNAFTGFEEFIQQDLRSTSEKLQEGFAEISKSADDLEMKRACGLRLLEKLNVPTEEWGNWMGELGDVEEADADAEATPLIEKNILRKRVVA